MDNSQRVLFTCALLKVASRCNLNCDYCYVYNHTDQSWRTQPHFMSSKVIDTFIIRLKEYITLNDLKEFTIVYHGGEPLLYGLDHLRNVTKKILAAIPDTCQLSFS